MYSSLVIGPSHIAWHVDGDHGSTPVVDRLPVQLAVEPGLNVGTPRVELAELRLHVGGVDRIQIQLARCSRLALTCVDAARFRSRPHGKDVPPTRRSLHTQLRPAFPRRRRDASALVLAHDTCGDGAGPNVNKALTKT
jgi:hypothetical protein